MMDVYQIGALLHARRKELLPIVAIFPILYLAWFLSWFGTVATTCTGASTGSVSFGLMISTPFFGAGILCLCRYNLGTVGLLLALPLACLLAHQAVWAVELFSIVNVNGRSACTLITGDDFGEAHDGWVERSYAPYYFALNVGSLLATAASYWRHLRRSRTATIPEIFD